MTPDRIIPLTLGDTTIECHAWCPDREGVTLVHLHANERTAVRAGWRTKARHPVRLFTLAHHDGRLVSFRLDDRTWQVDPNRVFSPAGAAQSLRRHNGAAPATAVEAVARFGEQLVAAWGIHPPGPVVALHNNADDGSLTIHHFVPGARLAAEAAAVAVGDHADPVELVLVTERPVFEALARMGYNAVLQADDCPDDGSLSVYCGRRGVSYVNVEARHAGDDTAHNERMIADVLSQLTPGGAGG